MRVAILSMALGGLWLAGAALSQEVAGDPASGRKLAGQCRTCHGIEGAAKMPAAPSIGGEPASFLASQLTAFRSGTRQNEMMSVVAAALSDQQIADLAAWYSSQTAVATLTADPSGAPESCVSCHGVDGMGMDDDTPDLAGENSIYLLSQLKAFRQGSRPSEIMQPIAESLDDDQMRAAADWYASVKLEIAKPE